MNNLLLGPIIGGLTSTSANFWARATGPAILHAWIGQRPNLRDAHLAGTSLPLTAENGFAGVAPVRNLSPGSHYRYALTLTDSPPTPNQAPFPKFTTFPPDRKPVSFSFAFGSCFLPEDENGGQIFCAVEKRCQQDNLQFILMMGDQIYADAYHKNEIDKVATTLMDYRDVYAYTWSRPPLRHLLARMPAFMTLDDHEVDDDWAWTNPERTQARIPIWDKVFRWYHGRPPEERKLPLKRVRNALQAYWEHQGMHATSYIYPPQLDHRGQYALTPKDTGSLAYIFNYGACAFFVMDTRTMRVRGHRGKSILGEGQWQALKRWLLDVKDKFPVKFLVTSDSFLYDFWFDFAHDRWSGFPDERERLLHFLGQNGIEGVYLLSGDLHFAHAIRAEINGSDGHKIPLWEFCATPFEQKSTKISLLYKPIRSKCLNGQELLFIVDQLNFGVVRVNFSDPDKPIVRFEVRGKNGELLEEAG